MESKIPNTLEKMLFPREVLARLRHDCELEVREERIAVHLCLELALPAHVDVAMRALGGPRDGYGPRVLINHTVESSAWITLFPDVRVSVMEVVPPEADVSAIARPHAAREPRPQPSVRRSVQLLLRARRSHMLLVH